ncbi:hypothetical protein SAMN04488544_3812 [Microlunatus sagamiharensis]|uniref:Uncharacterized protein n=1 Tax=Microlunatus sagamiharensis TaxID=546874 RepID=A0A1H2NDP1_9ACTN|nr:hypothetical protein [Microlunatus sagamiharensis]SDV03530.1 hypothetical protein SAMN04488544_3812 [Microlunatus sagamiharensis]
MTEPERPPTDWEARVARAKRDGTWSRDPDEPPSPYPTAVKRRRFLVGFLLTLAAGILLGALVEVLLGDPGSPWAPGTLLEGFIRSVFPAALVGWGCTRGPRTRR